MIWVIFVPDELVQNWTATCPMIDVVTLGDRRYPVPSPAATWQLETEFDSPKISLFDSPREIDFTSKYFQVTVPIQLNLSAAVDMQGHVT
jgi:hypothetical protein